MKKPKDIVHTIVANWFYCTVFPYGSDEHYSTTTVCAVEVRGRNIYIYSNRPGFLIGKAGSTYDVLKKMLKSAGVHKKVRFVDLGPSGYVKSIRVKRKWF